ncbi:MAG: tetratricopeptide repeat protein, partial [Clostridia bacterium]|nr:tetratricopeptide repeat protein [Clostridia bacterium]
MGKEVKVKKRVRRVKVKKNQEVKETVKSNPKKTWSIVLTVAIAVIVLFVILAGIYVLASYLSPANKIVKILEEGNTALESQDYNTALEAYRKALELKPESEEIKSHISNVYVMQA